MPMPLEQTRRGLNIDDLGYDSSLENIYDLNSDNDIRNAQLAIERTAAWMARKEHGQPIDRNTNTRDVPLQLSKKEAVASDINYDEVDSNAIDRIQKLSPLVVPMDYLSLGFGFLHQKLQLSEKTDDSINNEGSAEGQ